MPTRLRAPLAGLTRLLGTVVSPTALGDNTVSSAACAPPGYIGTCKVRLAVKVSADGDLLSGLIRLLKTEVS